MTRSRSARSVESSCSSSVTRRARRSMNGAYRYIATRMKMASVKKMAAICIGALFQQWIDLCADLVNRRERSDLHILQHAVLIDEVGLGHTLNFEIIRDRPLQGHIQVFAIGIGDAELLEIDEGIGGGIHIIHTEEDYLTGRFILKPCPFHFGGFLFAGLAP